MIAIISNCSVLAAISESPIEPTGSSVIVIVIVIEVSYHKNVVECRTVE